MLAQLCVLTQQIFSLVNQMKLEAFYKKNNLCSMKVRDHTTVDIIVIISLMNISHFNAIFISITGKHCIVVLTDMSKKFRHLHENPSSIFNDDEIGNFVTELAERVGMPPHFILPVMHEQDTKEILFFQVWDWIVKLCSNSMTRT